MADLVFTRAYIEAAQSGRQLTVGLKHFQLSRMSQGNNVR